MTARDAFNNTATAYSGTVHFTSSDGAATLPANSTLTNGVGTFSATLKTAGIRRSQRPTRSTPSITGVSGTVTVNPGAATQFLVSAPASATAASAFNLTVTARDAFNNTATSYSGTAHFISSDGAATLPANSTLTNGVGTFSATLKSVGNQTITATDTVTPSITGVSGTVTVNPGTATQFVVSAPASATAGGVFSFTVTARDAFNNTATSYSGTAHFTSSDGTATLPANSTLTNGVGTFSATLKTAGSQTITATDTVTLSITGVSGTVAVGPSAGTHLLVSAASPATMGTAFNVTVTAQDAFNNTATGYTGAVRLTSTDAAAALPPNSALINGVGIFPVTLNTQGTQTITATDTVTGSIAGTSGSIAVAGLATFTVTSLADSGTGTLRAAITAANASTGGAISFAVSGTIHLATALPALTQSMAISGPRASSLVLDGGGAVQVFNVQNGITVSISGVTVQNGFDTGAGGGGIANRGILSLSSCAISSNLEESIGQGGGIYNSGTLHISQCTISNNQAGRGGAPGFGGGLFNTGTATILNSTFLGNTANGGGPGGGKGGAIFNNPSSVLNITGSTLAGNTATDPSIVGSAAGGAIYDLGVAVIANSTISGNRQTGTSASDFAGGIFLSGGSASLTDTILAGNSDAGANPRPDGSGAFTDGGYNLIGDGTGATGFTNGVSGTLVGTSAAPLNARLGVLAANGGPTQTMLPGGDSPALAAGSSAGAPSTDQRGFPRVLNGAIDIGAVQLQGVALTATAGTPQSANANGAFGTALVATATESCGSCSSPLPGVTVTFSPPGSGASGTFGGSSTVTTNATGAATAPAFTANAIAGGPYTVTASATTPEQVNPSTASFFLTNAGLTQIITGFGAIVSQPYGTVFAISGVSATSGLPVAFASLTPTVCTVSGGTVAVLSGTGTCSISATQSGGSTYMAAPTVVQSFQASRAALTVTANSTTKSYGATLTFAGTEFTHSALVNGDSVTGVTLASAGAAATAGVSGSPYPIVPTAATGSGLANYAITYVNGSLTENKATLTVTANNASKVYGAPLPSFGDTITGFLNGDSSAVVSGTPSIATTATATSTPATYPITISGTLTASNYTFTFVPGTLTVSKASTSTLLTSSALIASATIVVTPPGAGVPSGTVQFLKGTTVLGTVTLTSSTASLAVPAGTVTAVYSGDGNLIGSTSLPVNIYSTATSSLTLTSSVNPSVLGQSVTFTASVATSGPPGPPTGTVQFFDNTNFLGSAPLSGGQASFTTAALTGGSHAIIAGYNGDATFPGAQASFGQTINAAVTLGVTATPATAVYGQAVTLSTTVGPNTPPAGYPAPSGQVAYSVAGTTGGLGSPVGSAPLTAGVASLTVTTLPVGSDTVRAQYTGDSNWSSSVAGIAVTISQASTASSLSLSKVSGQLALVAAITAVAPGAGTPTGIVQFVNTADNSVVATANMANGSATANITASVAALPIVAMYGGDANFRSSTSAPLPAVTNAATNLSTAFAPDEIALVFNIAGLNGDTAATLPLTTSLAGVTVTVTDSGGTPRPAQLYGAFASAGQVNFVIPGETAPGLATVTIALPNHTTVSTVIQIVATAPGIFTANLNLQGPFAGQILYVNPDGTQTPVSSVVMNSATQQYVPNPISFATPGVQVFLVMYGTGLRHATSVTATANGVNVPVAFVGAQSQFPGMDQINLQLPASLAGSGLVNLVISADGQATNSVTAIVQ